MEKLGDVMDEPLVEDENGAIVDIGDAAAGSTLGTIAFSVRASSAAESLADCEPVNGL